MTILQIGLVVLSVVMVWHEIHASKMIMKKNAAGRMTNKAFRSMVEDFKKDPDFDSALLEKFISFITEEDMKSAKRMRWSYRLLAMMWACSGLSIFWVQTIIGTCILACIAIGLVIHDMRCFEKTLKTSDKMFDEMIEKRTQTIKSRLEKPASPNDISND